MIVGKINKNSTSEDKLVDPDSEKYIQQEQYCAFLDILGFREEFINNLNDKRQWQQEVLIRKYAQIMGEVEQTPAVIEKMLQEIYSETNISWVTVSDSIIITCNNLIWLAIVCGKVQRILLSHGFLLRGGISVGFHWELKHKNMFAILSKAYLNAFDLEENEAKFPRIILDPSIITNMDKEKCELICKLSSDGPFFYNSMDDNYLFINPFFHCYDYNENDIRFWSLKLRNGQNKLEEKRPECMNNKELETLDKCKNKWEWFAGFYKYWVESKVGSDNEINSIYLEYNVTCIEPNFSEYPEREN